MTQAMREIQNKVMPTPGTWEIDATSDAGDWEIWATDADGDGPLICSCESNHVQSAEESRANALLIVSAKKLLAALKSLLDDKDTTYAVRADRARHVIAQAEGRLPWQATTEGR